MRTSRLPQQALVHCGLSAIFQRASTRIFGRNGDTLSVGQTQGLPIALGPVNPSLVLAEPTAALDPGKRALV